ncbi:hypothetical protein POVWA2_023080 [Plasmodium ovale wallikeri]|uniref:Uncharacterized protein n=1 Tax=Plasmodium ovale wallikeri TaxID=864142 RepID=A0A1A8YSM1_PLAOA|nr:hypothetical protein POVWA1_023290 [Plasmodium ovale wallikeri]SBT35075.1 hypothetical protein POVWA2_023080 [Plasmodium ovale wallikeri]
MRTCHEGEGKRYHQRNSKHGCASHSKKSRTPLPAAMPFIPYPLYQTAQIPRKGVHHKVCYDKLKKNTLQSPQPDRQEICFHTPLCCKGYCIPILAHSKNKKKKKATQASKPDIVANTTIAS